MIISDIFLATIMPFSPSKLHFIDFTYEELDTIVKRQYSNISTIKIKTPRVMWKPFNKHKKSQGKIAQMFYYS